MGDLGAIARVIGAEYLRVRRTTRFQRKALRAIRRCRTPACGSISARCGNCGAEHVLFRSCRSRFCPRCQAQARQAWLEARESELLEVPYFHVVFTVPEMLNALALYEPEIFYSALLRAAGNALLDVGRSKLKAELGCLAILHTWGQTMMLHPHVHCVVPGGGFSLDRQRWISPKKPDYLLPIEVLGRRFRTLLIKQLRAAEREGRFTRLRAEVLPHTTIEGAAAQKWISYVKPPFGRPQQVLAYLSRYTHRVAISNSRIEAFDGEQVTFQWRDYADENKSKHMTVAAIEFLRRFLLHILPDRFVRIRYFGFMANRKRAANIARARQLIGRTAIRHEQAPSRPNVGFLCPTCYAAMTAQRPWHNRGMVRPPPQERCP